VRQARGAAAEAVVKSEPASIAEKRQITFLRCDLLPRESRTGRRSIRVTPAKCCTS